MVSVRRFSFVLLFISIAGVLWAGRLDKAFEALARHDYFKAKDSFEKSLKNEPMLSNYGLSIIFSRPNNPFYQLDSAYVTIVRSEKSYDKIKDKELKKIIEETSITSDTLSKQKQNVASLILDRAVTTNTVEALEDFISKYTFSVRMSEAQLMRDQLAFDIAKQKNTWQSYKYFADTYPKAAQISKAMQTYEKLLFEDKTKDGKVEQYAAFISQFPRSPYVQKAQDKIFELTVTDKNIDQYTSFVRTYPNSPYAHTAWQALYNLWFSDMSVDRVEAFRKKFPNSPMESILQEDIKNIKQSYFPILNNKLYGFISSNGNVVVEPKYDFVDDFSSRAALVGREDKIAYVDTRGNLLCEFVYDDGLPFKGELAVVVKSGAYGVINKSAKEIIPTVYDDITLSDTGCVLTEKDGVYQYFTRLGEAIFDPYTKAEPFIGKYAVVQDKETNAQLINFQGIKIFAELYRDIVVASDSTFFVKDMNDKWSYINVQGQILSPKKYDQVGRFSQGLAAVLIKDTYGYINTEGKEVIPVKLSAPSDITQLEFVGSHAKTSYRGKYGMINNKGARVLPNLFEDLIITEIFPVPVSKSGLWGYADKNFNIAIQCSYDSVEPLVNGRAVVVKKGQWGVINTKGVIVIPLTYSSMEAISENMYIVAKNSKAGLVDAENNILIPLEYDRVRLYKDNVLQLVRNEQFLYYDLSSSKFIYQAGNL